ASSARDYVRFAPRQNQSMDSRAVAGAPYGAAAVGGRPQPVAEGFSAAAGAAGGSRGGGHGPPFCHDGTERRIPRPKDADEQKSYYSGKKKGHTVKNVLLVNAVLLILFLSDTCEGSAHD